MRFVRSQVDKVVGKEVTLEVRDLTVIATYTGKTINVPVNLDRIVSFSKTEKLEKLTHKYCHNTDSAPVLPDIFFPTIWFNAENTSNDIVWCYPPTDEGELQRNADYLFLIAGYATRCPNTSPLGSVTLRTKGG